MGELGLRVTRENLFWSPLLVVLAWISHYRVKKTVNSPFTTYEIIAGVGKLRLQYFTKNPALTMCNYQKTEKKPHFDGSRYKNPAF